MDGYAEESMHPFVPTRVRASPSANAGAVATMNVG